MKVDDHLKNWVVGTNRTPLYVNVDDHRQWVWVYWPDPGCEL